jgi:hypothetical protein
MRRASRQNPSRVVVVEDSINSGWSINQAVGSGSIQQILGKAAVYCTPTGIPHCDVFGVELPLPHYFTWHMFGSNLLCKYPTGFDMDGLFCLDARPEQDDDGEKYQDFLNNVRPLYLYKGGACGAIITARIEKYRPQTEAWLRRYGVQYRTLVMGPWESKRERSQHSIAEWKGDRCRDLKLQLYVESDGRQAPRIATQAGIPVMCPAAKKVFTP